ncbi:MULTISPECIES: hypothetical protein [Brevibacterium]|nr:MULTISPECIES: hypothetical protein [Brevibacterium]MCT1828880.1 hypothetical protein [Brevibacterium luteolum]MCT1873085.1 hypothetical protein [Brevibacterium luteolum]MCT1889385.1 hypothetical protein [Brevibacterium luteolum]MCT1892970.1 hypothetical protein [Brevibacterium luteolum]MCT1923805.1 hypothetical protein [Brevibacterium luteolum]
MHNSIMDAVTVISIGAAGFLGRMRHFEHAVTATHLGVGSRRGQPPER